MRPSAISVLYIPTAAPEEIVLRSDSMFWHMLVDREASENEFEIAMPHLSDTKLANLLVR